MVHYKVSLFSILFFLTQQTGFTQNYPEPRVDALLKDGIIHIINQDYEGARIFFQALDDEYSNLPFGKIYLAAVSIAESYDYAEEFHSDFIYNNLEEAKEQSLDLLDEDEENLWYKYFYALSEGYIAYFNAINESWLSAVSTGLNSISAFEECLEFDTAFYESYIAIGTFEYWKSRKSESLSWLPFIDDNKSYGIERLITAIDSSSYNTYLAINSLIWIYIDQENYLAAIQTAEKALINFPESRLFRWGLVRAYEDVDPEHSINIYYEIFNSYSKCKESNKVNETILKHLIAQQYVAIGDEQKAIELCKEILYEGNIPESSMEKLEDRLERVEDLLRELTK
ncbi:MAG: hypothetical protein DRQ13_03660 [Ignavibacteriae bacterium]|nr:MAG: hypothetical protein DRQ13_03660 [Ignavibacteriota bacterium]